MTQTGLWSRFEELIKKHELSEFRQVLHDVARPAIRLVFEPAPEEEIPIGGSKAGGAMDVPMAAVERLANVGPREFLLQINFSELDGLIDDNPFPEKGIVSVGLKGEMKEADPLMIVRDEMLSSLQRRDSLEVPGGSWTSPHTPCRIRFIPYISIPAFGSIAAVGQLQRWVHTSILWQYLDATEPKPAAVGKSAVPELPDNIRKMDGHREQYEALARHLFFGNPKKTKLPMHHLLGHPYQLQNCVYTQWANNIGLEPNLWKTLIPVMQIDSDKSTGFMFLDAGRHYIGALNLPRNVGDFFVMTSVMECY